MFVSILFVGGYIGYLKYNQVFAKNVPDHLTDPYLYIPTGSAYENVRTALKEKGMLLDETSFQWVAEQMNFTTRNIRAGRFKIQGGWSNRRLINHLRSGVQAPVNVVLNNERLLQDVAAKVGNVIEADSASLMRLFENKTYLSSHDLKQEELMTIFIPNTYEFFWNQTAEQFLERMFKENDKFWSQKNRSEKAKNINLTKKEVYTLASIVERETSRKDEKPRIAGVYMNRLEKNILLQADPTVVFATGEFGLRRVLNKHLKFDSPYNTYMYAGLPPGPISMASINSIDAVLDMEHHDYIFFCAKGDGTGYHNFAKTLAGHSANRKIYAKNLKKRGRR